MNYLLGLTMRELQFVSNMADPAMLSRSELKDIQRHGGIGLDHYKLYDARVQRCAELYKRFKK